MLSSGERRAEIGHGRAPTIGARVRSWIPQATRIGIETSPGS
jgi:hypothetical protein